MNPEHWTNNICEEITIPADVTIPNSVPVQACICEIHLRKMSSILAPAGLGSGWDAVSVSNTAQGATAVMGRPGDGYVFHVYFDKTVNRNRLPYFDLFGTDGAVYRYAEMGDAENLQYWRLERCTDPRDNVTKYLYDASGRLSVVQYPSGLNQVYSYQPASLIDTSWTSASALWDSTEYSGVQIDYTDAAHPTATFPGHRQYLLFKKLRVNGQPVANSAPFAGDRLYRHYHSQFVALPDLGGADLLYALPGAQDPESYAVTELAYDGESARIASVSSLMATSQQRDAALTSVQTLRQFQWTEIPTASGRYRVTKETDVVASKESDFAYLVDPNQPTRIDMEIRTESDGTVITRSYDDRQRVVQEVVTPTNNAQGRPRASDSDSGGDNEPLSITTRYEFSVCVGCANKPTAVEVEPLGGPVRRYEYDYEPSSGLLWKMRYPSPAGAGVVEEVYTHELSDPLVLGGYRLASRKAPDGSLFTYSYTVVPRVDAAHGVKSQTVTMSSPSITLASGVGASVATVETFDVTAPTLVSQRQLAFVGQLVRVIDGDGVTTDFGYDGYGVLDSQVVNDAGGVARIETALTHDRMGRLVAVTANQGSSESRSAGFEYNSANLVTREFATVNGHTVEKRYFYDRHRKLSVQLETNKDSAGGVPAALGVSSGETARPWIRKEWHYAGEYLVRTQVDRRTVDRDDASEPVADHPLARYLQTDFVWSPTGRIINVLLSNGATRTLQYDGYGTVYKDILSDPTLAEQIVNRTFVNPHLEPVRAISGDGADLLVTVMERNHAGLMTALVEPQAVGVPIWYSLATAYARHERDYDSRGLVIAERLLDGATSALLSRTESLFDELGRVYQVGKFDPVGGATPSSVTRIHRAGASRVTKVVDPAGRFAERTYDASGRLTKVVDALPGGPNEVLYSYADYSGVLRQIKRRQWDEYPGVGAYKEYIAEYEFDALGRLTRLKEGSQSAPLLHAFAYYSTGQTESYTDPAGKVQRYLPDALGRRNEHLLPGTAPILNTATYIDYTGTLGQSMVLRQDGRGRTTRELRDFAGRLRTLMNPGALVEPTIGSPHQEFATLFAYDAHSRVVDVYQGDGILVSYTRDGVGRVLARSSGTPSAQSPVSWFHGRDVHRLDARGLLLESWHQYGANGQGGDYLREQFAYDDLGRRIRESYRFLNGANWVDVESDYEGADGFRTGVHYDNNLASDADDLWVDYAPDAVGRLNEVQWQVTGGVPELLGEYLHEGASIRRRTTYWGTGGAQKFSTDYRYDAWGRMDQIEHSFSAAATVQFVYDGSVQNGFLVSASNLVKEIYQKQGGATQVGDRFAYDEHHRLSKAWMGSDQAHLQATDPEAYAPLSPVDWVRSLNYGLDEANNRTAVTAQVGPLGAPSGASYSTQDQGEPGGPSNRYDSAEGVAPTYDQRGNTTFDGTFFYVYDDHNRLTEVYLVAQSEESNSLASPMSSQTSAGTMASRSAGAGAFRVIDMTALTQARARILAKLPGGPGEVLQRASEPGMGATLREVLSPAIVQRVSSSGSTSLSGASQSATVPPAIQLVALYLYDSGNRRVIRSVINVQNWFYAWDGWSEAEELVLGVEGESLVVKPERQFVWGEQLDELVSYRYRQPGQSAWAEFFVAEGGAHCPSRVLNESGAVVEIQEYDPYGKASFYDGSGAYVGLGTQFSVGNPFQWKGHRVDPETGLTYMRNRYYSAKWGRFVTQDPLGVWGDNAALGNGYGYGLANPLVQVDRLGLQVTAWVGGAMEGRGGSSMAQAKRDHQGAAGAHGYFPDLPGKGDDEAIIKWVVQQYRAQLVGEFLIMGSEDTPCSPPVVTLIGHSLGGAQIQRVAIALAAMGITVNYLISLDPVGSRDGLLSWDAFLELNGGGLGLGDTYWVNSYNMTLADNLADIPVPIVSNVLGGLFGMAQAMLGGTDPIAGGAQAGDRQGHESGAVNYELDGVPHENASGYLGGALNMDARLRAGLVSPGILRL